MTALALPTERQSDNPVPSAQFARNLAGHLHAEREYNLAFPGATDLTFPDLADILTSQLLNNVGDPWTPGHGPNQTKQYEVAVIELLGRLFGAGNDVWGYVAAVASEGTLHALYEARTAHPDVIVYASVDAHYSVAKAARLLGVPLQPVAVGGHGRMQLEDLCRLLQARPGRAAAIVATVGTTEREAVDDVAGIAGLCQQLGIVRRRIHVDAALAGIPLRLLPVHERPAFGFEAGATSIVVSGHKFLSTLMPCAAVVYPRRPGLLGGAPVSYIGASDTTIAGSRSGHTPLLMWWSLNAYGFDGHRRRAYAARELAGDTAERLHRLGWPVAHQPHAFTVTLAQPPTLARPWVLGGDALTGRIITMPGIHPDWIGEFLTDLTDGIRGRVLIPAPRRPGGTA